MTRKIQLDNTNALEKVNIEAAPQFLEETTLNLLDKLKQLREIEQQLQGLNPNDKLVKIAKIMIQKLEEKINDSVIVAVDSHAMLNLINNYLNTDNSMDLSGETVVPKELSENINPE